ncbi:MAG TPA: biotin/lipoyl-containing protein, partial [Acidimicrobiales bacterium]|nr:biotin/lipoyl-containing protein [Acidimicrobiales bacterium]
MADVLMPQLGETVTEGTITKWLKSVGETVERDEPLFEVSTDKVDSEVPSPASGTLNEIRVPEGETADVGTVLAVIADGSSASATAPSAESPKADVPVTAVASTPPSAPVASVPPAPPSSVPSAPAATVPPTPPAPVPSAPVASVPASPP